MEKFQNKYCIPSARANWHNYNGGVYFVTICTKIGNIILGKLRIVVETLRAYVQTLHAYVETLRATSLRNHKCNCHQSDNMSTINL